MAGLFDCLRYTRETEDGEFCHRLHYFLVGDSGGFEARDASDQTHSSSSRCFSSAWMLWDFAFLRRPTGLFLN